jgi:hypothetical protein
MEAARKLKANLKLDGKPCGWCSAPLKLGDDAAVCTSCEREHHSRCWDGKAGCSTASCTNAPLKQLKPEVVTSMPFSGLPGASALPPGMMACPTCRATLLAGTMVCNVCRAITSPDGIYHGPKTNAPGAVASLVCGIIGLLICGVVLGPIAISQANNAKRAIENDPTLGGSGLATAGFVLGIIDLVFFVLFVLVRLGSAA